MLVSVCHSNKNILCLAVTGFLGGGSITNQTYKGNRYSNHPFLGANMLVSGRVNTCKTKNIWELLTWNSGGTIPQLPQQHVYLHNQWPTETTIPKSVILLMEEILHTTWNVWNPVNKKKCTISTGDSWIFFHQQYVWAFWNIPASTPQLIVGRVNPFEHRQLVKAATIKHHHIAWPNCITLMLYLFVETFPRTQPTMSNQMISYKKIRIHSKKTTTKNTSFHS